MMDEDKTTQTPMNDEPTDTPAVEGDVIVETPGIENRTVEGDGR